MATLSKHGDFVIVDFLWHRSAFCEDREVLRNYGSGWRVFGHIKSGASHRVVAADKAAARDKLYAQRPCLSELRRQVEGLCPGRAKREYLRSALDLLHDDVDGLYSTLTEHPINLDVDLADVAELARWFDLAREEGRQMKGGKE